MTSRARAKQRRREAQSSSAERAGGAPGGEAQREPGPPGASPGAPPGEDRRPPLAGILGDTAIVLTAFAIASALAAALGAANFGTALTFGQIGFALALAYVLVRRR